MSDHATGNSIDLRRYFARTGYDGPEQPTVAALRRLVPCHLTAIAFENLDPFLGRPVRLEPEALQAKLVRSRRGGYCHEHNRLFHDVLAALGFPVVALGGRVVWTFQDRPAPLTHRLTLVHTEDGDFIADVGVGGQTPPAPLRLEPGLEQATSHGTYRIGRDGDVFELQLRLPDRWAAMYRFDLAPQSEIDFEVANWYTSTYPGSRFVENLIVCRIVGDTRVNLLNSSLSVRQADGRVEQRALTGSRELGTLLENVMGLALPVSADEIWARLPKSAA